MINKQALQQVLAQPARPVSLYTIAHRDKLGISQHKSFDEVMLDIWPSMIDNHGRLLFANELEAVVLALRMTRKLRPRKRPAFRPIVLTDDGKSVEEIEDYADTLVAKGIPRDEAMIKAHQYVGPYRAIGIKRRYSSSTNNSDMMDMITSLGAHMLLESGPYSDVPTTERLLKNVNFYSKFFVPQEELDERNERSK